MKLTCSLGKDQKIHLAKLVAYYIANNDSIGMKPFLKWLKEKANLSDEDIFQYALLAPNYMAKFYVFKFEELNLRPKFKANNLTADSLLDLYEDWTDTSGSLEKYLTKEGLIAEPVNESQVPDKKEIELKDIGTISKISANRIKPNKEYGTEKESIKDLIVETTKHSSGRKNDWSWDIYTFKVLETKDNFKKGNVIEVDRSSADNSGSKFKFKILENYVAKSKELKTMPEMGKVFKLTNKENGKIGYAGNLNVESSKRRIIVQDENGVFQKHPINQETIDILKGDLYNIEEVSILELPPQFKDSTVFLQVGFGLTKGWTDIVSEDKKNQKEQGTALDRYFEKYKIEDADQQNLIKRLNEQGKIEIIC